MELYVVVSVMLAWIALVYAWVVFGPYVVETFIDEVDDLGGLIYYLLVMACALSWPAVAFAYRIGFDWYWWLLMIGALGWPFSIWANAIDISTFGYTYSDRGKGAIVEYTLLWLITTVIWPLQALRKYYETGAE